MRTKKNLNICLFLAAFFLAVVPTATGRVIYVDADATGANNGSTWSDAHRYLQDALAAADNGDQVYVAEGIYKPNRGRGMTRGDRTASFQLKNGVALYGGFVNGQTQLEHRNPHAHVTILSGDLNGDDGPNFANSSENSYHVITSIHCDETAILDGFTITGGNANNADIHDIRILRGGGMYNESGSPMLINCTFISNQADIAGGGLCNYGDSNPTLINCTFSGNSAQGGGGMRNFAGCSPVITNCTFSGNLASSRGGAIYNQGECNPTLTNCKIIGNTAGIMYVSYGFGGGICNRDRCNPILINCIIAGNSAKGNSTNGYGGGICFRNIKLTSTLTLINCTFAGNSAPKGNALACYSYNEDFPTSIRMTNCILWDELNHIWNSDNSVIRIDHSNVRGGWFGIGNIITDPMFVDADGADNIFGTEDDNLHLSIGSPCIDAGDNTTLPPSIFDDLGGHPRIINGIVDMGAYEFRGLLNWYVDMASGNDDNDGLTLQTALATISKAIDVAEDGDTVLVYPGIYQEEINFLGKTITVQGVATNDGIPILQNPGDFAASFYYNEGPDSILKNFVIRNSFMAIFIAGSSPTISNVTIVDNKYGIEAYAGSEPDISSSILWNNTDGDLFGCQARYSFIQRETQEVPVEGLISHWKFDEESGTIAYDSAGNNDGIIHGAQWTTGQINGALDFDGLDDYVQLPANEPVWLPRENFTLSVWVYFEHKVGWPSHNLILDLNYGASATPSNELGYNILRSENSSTLWFQITTTTNSDEDLYTDQVLYSGRWYHIVAVRNNTLQAAYIDGQLAASRDCSPDPVDFVGGYDNDQVNIGRYTTALGQPRCHLKGKIDEVMIFGRALAGQEIGQLYEGAIPTDLSSPLFVDMAGGDYHLRSERGRYWPEHDIWVLDNVTSPCIDGGDPMANPSDEPMPNGGRINMGAYGGTAYASLSEMVCVCDDL